MIEYTVKVNASGDKAWYLDGKLHREDGPAVEYASGSKAWYLDGKRHRQDGPALEWADSGNKYWYLNDKRHRADGPAIEYADGDKSWYLNDEELTESEFNKRTACSGKVVKIEGVKYKLVEV